MPGMSHSTVSVMLANGLHTYLGGVAITMVGQPAILAGTASMSAVDGSTAVPPGTYRPTAPMHRHTVHR